MSDFETRRDMAWEARKTVRTPENARRIAGPVLQAAIAARHVTGSPEWDRLLSIIQVQLESAKAVRRALADALMAPNLTDPQTMMQIRIDVLLASERIKVFEAVVALPAGLMRDGELARLDLEELEKA